MMRTTLEILLAVRDCEPCTEEELRLAICAMESIEHFIESDLQKLADCVLEGKPQRAIVFRARCALGTIERMFEARKTPPDKWLGPNHIPGTPEYAAEMKWAKGVFKKATGIDLDATKQEGSEG